jgi:membrane protein implicated in regulation of membrane protease activity
MESLGEFINSAPAWYWWAFGAILLGIEMLSTTQYLLWPGIAAIVVGFVHFLFPGLDGSLSVFLFAVLSIVATIAWKRSPWGRNAPQHPTLNRRTEQYVGRLVKAAVNFSGGRGAVMVDDSRWNAVVIDGSAPVAGDMLEVAEADGTLLKVRLAPGSLLYGAQSP